MTVSGFYDNVMADNDQSVMLRQSHTAQPGQIMTHEGSGLVTKEAPFELTFEEPMGSLLINITKHRLTYHMRQRRMHFIQHCGTFRTKLKRRMHEAIRRSNQEIKEVFATKYENTLWKF